MGWATEWIIRLPCLVWQSGDLETDSTQAVHTGIAARKKRQDHGIYKEQGRLGATAMKE